MKRELIGPPRPGVLEEELEDELLLFHPATNQVTVLNRTGADVWLLADGKHTFDEIVEHLASAYSLPTVEVRPDVERAIAELHDAGLFQSEELSL